MKRSHHRIFAYIATVMEEGLRDGHGNNVHIDIMYEDMLRTKIIVINIIIRTEHVVYIYKNNAKFK